MSQTYHGFGLNDEYTVGAQEIFAKLPTSSQSQGSIFLQVPAGGKHNTFLYYKCLHSVPPGPFICEPQNNKEYIY